MIHLLGSIWSFWWTGWGLWWVVKLAWSGARSVVRWCEAHRCATCWRVRRGVSSPGDDCGLCWHIKFQLRAA